MTPVQPPRSQLSFDELGTPLRTTTFVVFDLETTGGSAEADTITEFGAVKVRGGEVIGEFATLVDPGRGIPPEIISLTGITNAMVCVAPPLEQVLPAFLEFAAGSVLVAHNSGFDIGFLRAACHRYGYPWPRPAVVCTVKLARRVLSREEAPSCRLAALAQLFRATTTPVHRALPDAQATVDVLHGLLERVGSLGVHTLEELVDYIPDVTPEQRRKRAMAKHLPHEPGVYLFRGPGDEVLYVGTASDLRRRVRQYFTASETRRRLREMVRLAVRVDSVSCAHALEAEVRELRLLAAHKPMYNRRSKNPRQAWWVTLTDEAFPRLSVVRVPRDGALGPFRSPRLAEEAALALQDATGIRPCTQRISARRPTGSPCALAELGRCGAPCAGRQTVGEYEPMVTQIRALVAGLRLDPLRHLADRLTTLARAGRYEQAMLSRDRMRTLIRVLDRGQRLTALAAVAELVAARPDSAGGWEFAVVRHGRLACAGVARRGVPPMPVVDALVASAETVLPSAGPLRGAPPEEVSAVLRWLDRPGTRMVRCSQPWTEPARCAASWRPWLERADSAYAEPLLADGDRVVRGGRRRRGGETGVRQVETVAEGSDRGRDVEPRVGEALLEPAAAAGPIQPEHRDPVELVLHHVQRSTLDEQAVAVGEQLTAEVHGAGDAGGRIDPEQQPGGRLDDQQRPSVRGPRDAVDVEPGAVHIVPGQRQPDHVGLAGHSVPVPRDAEQERVVGVGEPGRARGEHDVVDERGGRGERVRGQDGAGAQVDEPGVAGRAAGDVDPALVGLQAHRRGARPGADDPAGSGDQVDPEDPAVGA
jgi:DNA polymerase III subunit epsilon